MSGFVDIATLAPSFGMFAGLMLIAIGIGIAALFVEELH